MSKVLVDIDKGQIVDYRKSERFTKKMREVWRYVYKQELFTAAEERILNRLADFLQLGTNAIVSTGGEYLSIEGMAKQVGMDASNMRKTMKGLVKKNAVGIWKSGDVMTYYVNPFLFQCGDVDEFYFQLFDQEYHKRKKQEHIQKFRAGKKYTSLVV